MAKNTKSQPKKKKTGKVPANALPQNILPVGERVEENKNIYISQAAYKAIHRFTKNKTTNESGGMLIGTVIEDLGKTNILISDFVEAKHCEATPTTLTFTHETWAYVHKEIEKKHKNKKIVGWIHTHPDFGIFLSEYDKFIHQNFFSEENQIAFVVDPIQKIEGFYFWINGVLEKCKGFYIYDDNGVPIDVDTEKDAPAEEVGEKHSTAKNIWLILLSVVVALLIFANISANSQLDKLEKEIANLRSNQLILEQNQKSVVASANQVLALLQEDFNAQTVEIQELRDVLIENGLIEEPTVPEETIPQESEGGLPTDA